MKKIKKTGKQQKVVKKSKPTKKVVKAQKPKNKIKKQTVHTAEFHVNEKISRPRGRPKGKKNKKEAVEGVEKKISNVYFTPDTESAIVAYNETEDPREKDKIYNEKIQGAFGKIAENIYNTFKFSYADVSPIDIQKQAISHMVANMSKYEKGKGKAFSYFSIVAKHWFILDNNTTYRRFKKHVEICEQTGDSGEFVVQPEHEKQESEAR
jgi:hypothetical protein